MFWTGEKWVEKHEEAQRAAFGKTMGLTKEEFDNLQQVRTEPEAVVEQITKKRKPNTTVN